MNSFFKQIHFPCSEINHVLFLSCCQKLFSHEFSEEVSRGPLVLGNLLFYGPPDTGKTLVARALVEECSSPDRHITLFMREGADCLCKCVGEGERGLRSRFDQAYRQRPSIIVFDEIDGLAPLRSGHQDQIYASIVSTPLALMGSLSNRGEVVLIGATNRLDAIDPATL